MLFDKAKSFPTLSVRAGFLMTVTSLAWFRFVPWPSTAKHGLVEAVLDSFRAGCDIGFVYECRCFE